MFCLSACGCAVRRPPRSHACRAAPTTMTTVTLLYTDGFVIVVIVMAGAMVGVQTYPEYSCAASDAACGQPWLGDKGEGAVPCEQ